MNDTSSDADRSGRIVVVAVAGLAALIAAYFALGMPGMDHETDPVMGADMDGMDHAQMELRELSVQEFADRMGDPESVTINVHVPVGESIEGTDAVVPYDDIEDSDSLPKDRATTLLLYCETGRMSTRAGQALLDQGYLEVSHLKGGLAAWRAAGLPTTSSVRAAG
jgi:rhodanese-related sulfurtransferase